jgi:hypothetical protein
MVMKKVAQSYTIGRTAFAKISAVEGIRLTPELRKNFQAFEKNNVSHADRRQAIARKYAH